MNKIKIGIVGFGNLGKGVVSSVKENEDMELFGVFTRRPLGNFYSNHDVNFYKYDDILNYKDEIDVLILCGGSAKDLPEQTPFLSKHFNVVDSFDTHNKIPDMYSKVNESSFENNKVSVISVGWDPGLFSMNRLIFESILPKGNTYTFWGDGVSQGHSDAIRKIQGVLNAKQYTIPVKESIEKVRNGENPVLTTREKHKRVCFVFAEKNADKEQIENEIKNMPDYFVDYDTTVNFVSNEELLENHSGMPHGGFVIRSGENDVHSQIMEFSLKLDSNPYFTSSVLTAYARAAYKLNKENSFGCKTVFDIPLHYISPKTREELIKELL